jgi:hypothetical protein
LFLLSGFVTDHSPKSPQLKVHTGRRGKRTLNVESKSPSKSVSSTNDAGADQEPKGRIGRSVVGDPFSVVAASVGTTIEVKPAGGKAEIVFENREAFPISISVFRK